MSKPTQTTIDLSIELYKLGVRKEIEEGDWYCNEHGSCQLAYHKVSIVECIKWNYIPIWIDCDECIELLREKVRGDVNIDMNPHRSKKNTFSVRFFYREVSWMFLAPTLIKALLLAMVEVGK